MFLRATRIQAPPDKVDAAIENFKASTVKTLRSAPGNQGAVLLVDRKSGAALGVTYWESVKALASSEQTGMEARTQAATSAGARIVNVERAELMIMDRAAAPKAGTFVRLVTANGDPEKLDAAIVYIRNQVLPILKAQHGYQATVASIDRQTGRLSVSTVWETKDDETASESKLAGPRAEAAKIAGAGPHDVQIEVFETAVVDISAAVTQTPARA